MPRHVTEYVPANLLPVHEGLSYASSTIFSLAFGKYIGKLR